MFRLTIYILILLVTIFILIYSSVFNHNEYFLTSNCNSFCPEQNNHFEKSKPMSRISCNQNDVDYKFKKNKIFSHDPLDFPEIDLTKYKKSYDFYKNNNALASAVFSEKNYLSGEDYFVGECCDDNLIDGVKKNNMPGSLLNPSYIYSSESESSRENHNINSRLYGSSFSSSPSGIKNYNYTLDSKSSQRPAVKGSQRPAVKGSQRPASKGSPVPSSKNSLFNSQKKTDNRFGEQGQVSANNPKTDNRFGEQEQVSANNPKTDNIGGNFSFSSGVAAVGKLQDDSKNVISVYSNSPCSKNKNPDSGVLSLDNIAKLYNDNRMIFVNSNLLNSKTNSKQYCGKCIKISCNRNPDKWDFSKQGTCEGAPIVLKVVDQLNNNKILFDKYPSLFTIDKSHYDMLAGSDSKGDYLPIKYQEIDCPF